MKRRQFIGLVGVMAAWPWSASAEVERRLGLLMPFPDGDPLAVGWLKALRQSLAGLGWHEGGNLKIEVRWSEGDVARTRADAKEMVETLPDAILAHGPAFPSVREATRAIPLVFVAIADPVGQGFVTSLSRPGGNITGFMLMEFSVGGKFVELLKEVAPETKHVAVFEDPSNSTSPQWWRSIEGAARDHGIAPQQALVRDEAEIDAAIEVIARAPNGSIIVPPQAFFAVHRSHLIASAARERLPVVYNNSLFVREGGLLSYGPDLADQYARAASYIDRILKGAKPNDLPVQGPTKFEFAINLKTAKTLGLAVPATLLARADVVIE
jgi:putative tryptophan/tyrosine transport system substrate-binding protein